MTENNISPSYTSLVEWFSSKEKDPKDWRIGTEHEKFIFSLDGQKPVAYEGDAGIEAILRYLSKTYDMKPIKENEKYIALKTKDGASISLEPGGQFELSGNVVKTIHHSCIETNRHLKQMLDVTAKLGLGMLGLGFHPTASRAEVNWMPKGRYKIMRDYMPKVGNLGLDMMLRTCTIQTNLDYCDEQDMRRKFKTSLALQPVATALFANSPFKDGALTSLQSNRALVWTDTDPDRCGVPTCVFEPNFGYEQWVDYVLDVPMYFIYRNGEYLNVAGKSFRRFMSSKHRDDFFGHTASMSDFEDHITTVFPDVRLKGYLEMRGADGGPWSIICALPALWVGLLYDEEALEKAEAIANKFTHQDVVNARISAAKDGLKGQQGSHSLHELASQIIEIAETGLRNRARFNKEDKDETIFLKPLRTIVDTGLTQADIVRKLFHEKWAQDIQKVFEYYKY